jgi:hypothetical protein
MSVPPANLSCGRTRHPGASRLPPIRPPVVKGKDLLRPGVESSRRATADDKHRITADAFIWREMVSQLASSRLARRDEFWASMEPSKGPSRLSERIGNV